MDNHQPNDDDYCHDVDRLEYPGCRILSHSGWSVDIGQSHLTGNSGMAFPTGGLNIGWVDGRLGIRSRQYAVSPVAGGAVRDRDIARLALQTVEAVNKALEATDRKSIFFVQICRFMAWGTGGFRNPSRIDRRPRIAGRNNPMFAVTIGAYRRIGFPSKGQFPVDPFPIIAFDPPMTFATRAGYIKMIDRRFRIPRRQNAVSCTSG